jgi:hypothetical protein
MMQEQGTIPADAILDTWSNGPWINGMQIDERGYGETGDPNLKLPV